MKKLNPGTNICSIIYSREVNTTTTTTTTTITTTTTTSTTIITLLLPSPLLVLPY